jgi:hypothetical protein
MWRLCNSGISRCFLPGLLLLVFVSGTSSAWATCYEVIVESPANFGMSSGQTFQTFDAACSAVVSAYAAATGGPVTDGGVSPTGAPTSSGTTGVCTINWAGSFDANAGLSAITTTDSCPAPSAGAAYCAGLSGMTTDAVNQGTAYSVGTHVNDSNGCTGVVATNPFTVTSGCPAASGGSCSVQTVTFDGGQSSTGTNPVAQGDCFTGSGGGQVCSQAAPANGGPQANCGTFNGDQVCVNTMQPGTCVQYASGGVACVASAGAVSLTSPPAPGSSGTPATPTGTVSSTSGTTTTTVSYFSSSTVTTAGGAVTSGSGGTTGGTSGTGQGGTVSVAPNAANGDCGAQGVNCAPSSVATTGFSGDCTDWGMCTENFYTAIASAPIVAGAVAIESAWPSGSCSIGSVSLATFGGRSFDYGTDACNVWNNYISVPLSALLLVVYGIAGVFIVLSA